MTVYSSERQTEDQAAFAVPQGFPPNRRCQGDGLDLLDRIVPGSVTAVFLDPQYRGVLDRMSYGNEGKTRGKRRCDLVQMKEDTINAFIRGISDALRPSGHLFLWMDKFHICEGVAPWFEGTEMQCVDLIVWNKLRMGNGYRTRRTSEYLQVWQKPPKRAKGCWTDHAIRDVWDEKAETGTHPHRKPQALIERLIQATSSDHDWILDPAAGSFVTLDAARAAGRNFIGCDLEG